MCVWPRAVCVCVCRCGTGSTAFAEAIGSRLPPPSIVVLQGECSSTPDMMMPVYCPANSYANGYKGPCLMCPPGKVAQSGSFFESSCRDACNLGQQWNPQANACTDCPPGTGPLAL